MRPWLLFMYAFAPSSGVIYSVSRGLALNHQKTAGPSRDSPWKHMSWADRRRQERERCRLHKLSRVCTLF